ncbi:MAG: metalloenzyme [Melioribacteraceae bacterium]|nr:metalloenzyme [Melioribacteraceae bacterium]
MSKTLLIFLDGVGIGEKDSKKNPFFKDNWKLFSEYFNETPHLDKQYLTKSGTYLFPADACMGVKGLPLSGTGQTSIFCGVNAPKIIGKHFGPYPYSTLVPIIEEKNIFRRFKDLGKNVVFANAYPKIFFDYINSGKTRLSVTSLSCLKSDVKLKNATDLRRGNALSAEIDNKRWVEKLSYLLPIVKPETAARRLFRLVEKHDLTVFEFFLTDHLGHGRIADWYENIILNLDRFLFYVLNNLDENVSLVICSDHGNFENILEKEHTRNPALTITSGKHAIELADRITTLGDITPAIMEFQS